MCAALHPPLERLAAIAGRTTQWAFQSWYWGDAIAIDGLLEADALGTGPFRRHVVDVLERWHAQCPPGFDDGLAPGAAIIALVMQGDLPAAAGERIFTRLEGLARIANSIPLLEPHRPQFRFGVCIDAVYHLPSTYAMAARWKDEAGLAHDGQRMALDIMRALECSAGWAQWFDPTRGRNNAVAWSRGLGWAVLGLLDLIALLGAGAATEIVDLAGRVFERLSATQAPDGNWAGVLDHPPAEAETSTAAFYVAAALHPAARGIISAPAPVLARAVAACARALSRDGTFDGVSADVLPSWDITRYERCPTEPSPWAQGAALRAFAALARCAAA